MGFRRAASRSRPAIPGGEEFPLFKCFWLERPGTASDVMVIHALLDSPSAAAAFRFTLRPGAETDMDTEMTFYPRVDLAAGRSCADDQHVPVRCE